MSAKSFTGGNKWWEKKEVVHTAWQPCVTADGLDYYYNTDTKETSWDKPEELMTPAELDAKGKWVWVPDDTECYVPGRLGIEVGSKTNVSLEDGSEKSVPTKELMPLSRSSLQRLVADLVLLDSMSSPLILHNLRQRFQQKLIYTNIGTILISVNPYKDLDLYNPTITRQYINRKLGQELPPHVFNVAFDAFYGLREFHQNQSIIISGESGAGKTEATKQCLAFLATSAGSVSHVHRKILQANPVLEAFGNAKTIRNDNSSRFGKFIRVFFSDQMRISGSLTQNYLLEKIRVCQQSNNERNFHIFYQLTKGGFAKKNELGLESPAHYRYLKTCADVATIDDTEGFKETLEALKELGFATEEVDHLFRTVAAILALGNVQFQSEGTKTVISEEKKTHQLVSRLLQVEPEKLASALTIRELRIKGQNTTYVNLAQKDASDTRDALAKFMYGEMFNWLVMRINESMGDNPKTPREIGILDIFGFEIFDHNTFEQLCINFTNEMLQQHFNHHTFRLEEAVYKNEGIQFKHIEFIDNQPMLDLITKKPTGILPLLDEELIMPKGSDATFLAKAHEKHGSNPVYKRVLKTPVFFIVRHYAGDVTYDTEGFLEKNRDTLTDDVLQMLYTSTSPFIQKLFPSAVNVSTKDKKKSLSSQFQDQLNALMQTLNATEPHYIRCVKPNHSKSSETFIPRIVYEQLTYSGVFEAVAIRKQGFPFRLSHEQFTDRYSVIFTDGRKTFEGDKLEGCKKVLERMRLNPENVQVGRTMILYRADEHKKLELDRSIKVRTIEVVDNIVLLLGKDISQYTDEQKEEHYSNLARSVTDADRFRLTDAACTRARAALESYVEARMDSNTKRLLEEAHASMEQAKLIAVLEICEEKGYATKLTRACHELLEQVDEAEAMLRVATDDRNVEYLTQALAFCDGFGYKAQSAQNARTLLNNINRANEQLKRVRASLNHEHMKICLDFCASFAYHTSEVDIVQKLYKKILQLREALTKAQKKVDEALLQEAVDGCDRVSYTCDLVEDCRTLLRRVKRINEEARRAERTYEEDHILAVVKAAKEIGLGGKVIKNFIALVDGPRQDFLKAQYDKAVSLNDHNRAVRIGITRKDLLVSTQRDQLALERYNRLREPMEWSSEKFWGDKQKRAENMLRFQRDTLHAPLTQIGAQNPQHDKFLRQKITNSFESVQKYMAQRNTSKLDQRVHELLTDSLEHQEIRTEVYLALIKQMRGNPEPQNIPQAWELLALCLTVFPPSPDFEDYLVPLRYRLKITEHL